VLLAAGLSLGCSAGALGVASSSGPVSPSLEPSTVDKSALCSNLARRFIGLPQVGVASSPTSGSAPSAGRWWIRSCTAEPRGAELQVRLEGPGWYWVDQRGSGMRVQQQVPFELKLTLQGTLHLDSSKQVVALWLEPRREPEVEARGPAELDVRSANGWGALLSVVPGLQPGKRAARQFDESLKQAFREQLRAGVTFTFNLRTGQADAAAGRLPPGQTPSHPFAEDDEWVVNDRLLLPPATTQVLGPIEAGSTQLDVIIESGPGLTYRAVCDDALEAHFAAIAAARLLDIPSRDWGAAGTIRGLGERTTELTVPSCKFYVVAATLGDSTTVASIRIGTPHPA
jgi:hypothetical protein